LAASRSRNDVAAVVEDPFESFAPNELLIKVGVKLLGDSVCVCSECFKSRNNMVRGERGHTIDPAVTSSNINKYQSVAVPAKGHIVTKHDIYVDLVEVALTLLAEFASRRIRDGGEITESGWKLACSNELGIG